MELRVPAPDGSVKKDGTPIMVLAGGAILNECYKTSFLTMGGMSICYRASKGESKYFAGDPANCPHGLG